MGVVQIATHFGSIVRRVYRDGVMEEVKDEHKKLNVKKKSEEKHQFNAVMPELHNLTHQMEPFLNFFWIHFTRSCGKEPIERVWKGEVQ